MNSRLLRVLVFCSGLSLMLIQIVSSRVLAPHLGTSIYAWTNIIATTLLGILVGNYIGGQISKQYSNKKVLGITFIAAGSVTLLSIFLVTVINDMLGVVSMHLAIKTALYTFSIFFPAATCLAAILPQVFRLDLRDLKKTGSSFGSLYAWSSIGNVSGLVLGGFFLIPLIGTKQILTAISALLILIGLYLGRGHALWKNRIALLIALFFIGGFVLPSYCQDETNYYCIRVLESTDGDESPVFTLKLDHLVHSYVDPMNAAALGYGYEEIYAKLIELNFGETGEFYAFFVGGGGYVLQRYIDAFYPEAHVTVAEIDPGVTEVNYLRMDLPRDTSIETVNEDARRFLQKTDKTFNMVFGDAFNDFSIPYHLTTVEFHKLLKSRMSEDGVYALNVIDDEKHGALLASLIRTLREVWTHVYVSPQADRFVEGRNTYVLIATDKAIESTPWASAVSYSDGAALTLESSENGLYTLLGDEVVEAFLAEHKEPVLRDTFVPVDRYLAPVFRDAY